MGLLELDYTKHAVNAMDERMIPIEWVESAVAEPALRTSDPNDPEVERFFRRIPERPSHRLASKLRRTTRHNHESLLL